MSKYILSILMVASMGMSGCSTLKSAFVNKKEKKAPCKFASLELSANQMKDCGVEIPLNQDYVPAGSLARFNHV